MKSIISVFVISFIIINSGCDSTTSPGIQRSISGNIKDIQGNLLSDVKVYILYDLVSVSGGITSKKQFDSPAEISGVILDAFAATFSHDGFICTGRRLLKQIIVVSLWRKAVVLQFLIP